MNNFSVVLFVLFTAALDIALFGGLIYFAFWCAKHFGAI